MMPHPPGRDSACRTGNGFQMSNTRTSIKRNSRDFQLAGARARRYVSICPETSSTTTNCGSFTPHSCDIFSAAQIPIADTSSTSSTTQESIGTTMVTWLRCRSVGANREVRRTSSQYSKTPTSEPHVPGANGTYPAQPAVATRHANREARCDRGTADKELSVLVFIGI